MKMKLTARSIETLLRMLFLVANVMNSSVVLINTLTTSLSPDDDTDNTANAETLLSDRCLVEKIFNGPQISQLEHTLNELGKPWALMHSKSLLTLSRR